jgi:hypothetical protein
MSGYFDIDTNPGKWGFMRAGAAIFNGGWGTGDEGSRPASNPQPSIPKSQGTLAIAKLQVKYGDNMLHMLTDSSGITYDAMLRTRILGWRMGDSGYTLQSAAINPQARLTWSVGASGQGFYQAASPLVTGERVAAGQAQVYTGHAKRFEEATEGRIHIASPDFVALTMTPLGTGNKVLITVCGRCENTGMQFSPDRRTVGRNWGHAPVQIEAVWGSLVVPDGQWICHALAPDGSPKQQVPISYENGRGTLTLSPEYGTMWYLLQ